MNPHPCTKGKGLTTGPQVCHFKFGLLFDKHVLLTFPVSSLIISYPLMGDSPSIKTTFWLGSKLA